MIIQFEIWFTAMCAIVGTAFVLWLIWTLFWIAYDHTLEQLTRKRNQQGTPCKSK
jgi:hypothetical protein